MQKGDRMAGVCSIECSASTVVSNNLRMFRCVFIAIPAFVLGGIRCNCKNISSTWCSAAICGHRERILHISVANRSATEREERSEVADVRTDFIWCRTTLIGVPRRHAADAGPDDILYLAPNRRPLGRWSRSRLGPGDSAAAVASTGRNLQFWTTEW